MITQRSGIVGVVISDFGNPFLASAVERLSKQLGRTGLQPLLIAADTEADLSAALPTLEQYRVDGCFVISPHMPRNLARRYRNLGTTILMFNPQMTGLDASYVSVDNVAAGQIVADLLAAEGHTRIGYVHGPQGAGTDRDRFAGFSARLEEHGLDPPVTDWGDYNYGGGARATMALVESTPDLTAIFCASDIMAMGAMDAARSRLGLGIPEDLSIVGFDDAASAAWPSYDLTTIHQPIDAMIDAGMEIILAAGSGEQRRPVQRVFDGTLVLRTSTQTRPDTDREA
ncbi:substrate-binding domain-containing protein [Bauldia sp.]|uniref:substrate-binding domain-containing protein n=1 Tax=Bauldia sp. TaxID=2575872 RepID=UPI003BAB54C9